MKVGGVQWLIFHKYFTSISNDANDTPILEICTFAILVFLRTCNYNFYGMHPVVYVLDYIFTGQSTQQLL
jgi:hypothetical protein